VERRERLSWQLSGEIAKALMAAAPDLLAKEPDIRLVDIVAVK
jgi:hypothetical protein